MPSWNHWAAVFTPTPKIPVRSWNKKHRRCAEDLSTKVARKGWESVHAQLSHLVLKMGSSLNQIVVFFFTLMDSGPPLIITD